MDRIVPLDRPFFPLVGLLKDNFGYGLKQTGLSGSLQVTEVPSRRHGPQVLIGDVARGVAVVSLLGEHDIATANDVRNALVTLLHTGAGVVVDLTETAFVDCSIMHVLDDSRRFASRDGGRVSFQLATRPIVRRVFEVLGFLEVWPVHGTRADAIRAVSQASRLEITDDGS